MARVNNVISIKPGELREIFDYLNVAHLKTNEKEFIYEYVKCLHPLARALDILQADKKKR